MNNGQTQNPIMNTEELLHFAKQKIMSLNHELAFWGGVRNLIDSLPKAPAVSKEEKEAAGVLPAPETKVEEPAKPKAKKESKKKETPKPAVEPEPEVAPETEAQANDELDFLGETKEVTIDDVREVLKNFALKHKKENALKLLAKFNAQSIPDLKKSDYAKVVELANRYLTNE